MNKKRTLLVVMTLAVVGCQTSVNPFGAAKTNFDLVPEAAMRELALEIEREIKAGNRDATFENREGISVDTEAIMQAIHTRAARAELISDFLDTGHAWERSNGRIYIKRSREYKLAGDSRSRDRDALIVNGENSNRWTLYEGIVASSNFSSRALSAVETIFTDARVSLLEPGQLYEDAKGEAVPKR